MKKLTLLFVVLCTTLATVAQNNVITYTAPAQLNEVNNSMSEGLYPRGFSATMVSHEFNDGVGTITFNTDLTYIGASAFSGCRDMTSVTLPNSITSIGSGSFSYCYALTSITLPSQLQSIGYGSFYFCKALPSVTLPDGLLSIGNQAFYCCRALSSINIPESVTIMGDNVFYGCYGLMSVTLSNNISSIGISAFASCTSLTSIIIPESVTSIGNQAFDGCTSLTSIIIPEGVTSIGDSAFINCSSLTSVTINSSSIVGPDYETLAPMRTLFGQQVTSFVLGDSITSIGKNTFYECNALTSINIPDSVTSIGDNAFAYCTALASITFPDKVNSIGSRAFYNCDSLTSLIIPDNVTSIGANAFDGCHNVTSATIGNGVSVINDGTFANCFSLASLNLGNHVTSIGSRAFGGCSSLTSVTIPNSVTFIGNHAFGYCYNLTSVTLGSNINSMDYWPFASCPLTKVNFLGSIADWCNIDFAGEASNPSYESHNLYINDKKVVDLVIPNSVTEIKKYAFIHTDIVSLTLPNSLTTINELAFNQCDSLTDIYSYALVPPTASNIPYQIPFSNLNSALHVFCSSLDDYVNDSVFGKFSSINCFEAEFVSDLDGVIVEPHDYSVTITWPTHIDAKAYTVSIFQELDTICSMVFNAQGELSAVSYAPGRNHLHQAANATAAGTGYKYTFNGLEAATLYHYSIETTDNAGNTVDSYSGIFATNGYDGPRYTISVSVNDPTMGEVTGAGEYDEYSNVTLEAIPNPGYRFVNWSNGAPDNPYTFMVLEDVSLTANFEAVDEALDNATLNAKATKSIRDGRLVITVGDKDYTAQGAEL